MERKRCTKALALENPQGLGRGRQAEKLPGGGKQVLCRGCVGERGTQLTQLWPWGDTGTAGLYGGIPWKGGTESSPGADPEWKRVPGRGRNKRRVLMC